MKKAEEKCPRRDVPFVVAVNGRKSGLNFIKTSYEHTN
jgi:hypothetical protein